MTIKSAIESIFFKLCSQQAEIFNQTPVRLQFTDNIADQKSALCQMAQKIQFTFGVNMEQAIIDFSDYLDSIPSLSMATDWSHYNHLKDIPSKEHLLCFLMFLSPESPDYRIHSNSLQDILSPLLMSEVNTKTPDVNFLSVFCIIQECVPSSYFLRNLLLGKNDTINLHRFTTHCQKTKDTFHPVCEFLLEVYQKFPVLGKETFNTLMNEPGFCFNAGHFGEHSEQFQTMEHIFDPYFLALNSRRANNQRYLPRLVSSLSQFLDIVERVNGSQNRDPHLEEFLKQMMQRLASYLNKTESSKTYPSVAQLVERFNAFQQRTGAQLINILWQPSYSAPAAQPISSFAQQGPYYPQQPNSVAIQPATSFSTQCASAAQASRPELFKELCSILCTSNMGHSYEATPEGESQKMSFTGGGRTFFTKITDELKRGQKDLQFYEFLMKVMRDSPDLSYALGIAVILTRINPSDFPRDLALQSQYFPINFRDHYYKLFGIPENYIQNLKPLAQEICENILAEKYLSFDSWAYLPSCLAEGPLSLFFKQFGIELKIPLTNRRAPNMLIRQNETIFKDHSSIHKAFERFHDENAIYAYTKDYQKFFSKYNQAMFSKDRGFLAVIVVFRWLISYSNHEDYSYQILADNYQCVYSKVNDLKTNCQNFVKVSEPFNCEFYRSDFATLVHSANLARFFSIKNKTANYAQFSLNSTNRGVADTAANSSVAAFHAYITQYQQPAPVQIPRAATALPPYSLDPAAQMDTAPDEPPQYQSDSPTQMAIDQINEYIKEIYVFLSNNQFHTTMTFPQMKDMLEEGIRKLNAQFIDLPTELRNEVFSNHVEIFDLSEKLNTLKKTLLPFEVTIEGSLIEIQAPQPPRLG